MLEGELVLGGDISLAAGNRAAHVETRVALILHVEDPCAGAEGPFRTGTPGDTQPGSEIAVVGSHQAVTQPSIAGHRHRGVEDDLRVSEKRAAADADQSGMAAERSVGRSIDV